MLLVSLRNHVRHRGKTQKSRPTALSDPLEPFTAGGFLAVQFNPSEKPFMAFGIGLKAEIGLTLASDFAADSQVRSIMHCAGMLAFCGLPYIAYVTVRDRNTSADLLIEWKEVVGDSELDG